MSQPEQTWIIKPEDEGARLDSLLARLAQCSRGTARRHIEDGAVRVNQRPVRKGHMVRAGDRVTLQTIIPDQDALRPVPQPELPLKVIFADADVLVLAKAVGMASHPLRAGERGTLANALVARYPECSALGRDPREAGLVNRLDNGTSGAIVAARNAESWEALRRSFHEHTVVKEYLALVSGQVAAPLNIEVPIAHRGQRMVVDPAEGLTASTQATPLASGSGFTLMQVSSNTGRMHQVRVHLAYADHPLVGDELYGGPLELEGAPGVFLHASRLILPHPRGAGTIDVSAPLPAERAAALARLGITFP